MQFGCIFLVNFAISKFPTGNVIFKNDAVRQVRALLMLKIKCIMQAVRGVHIDCPGFSFYSSLRNSAICEIDPILISIYIYPS